MNLTATKIKNKKIPNDVVITPRVVAKSHISDVVNLLYKCQEDGLLYDESWGGYLLYDPFRNNEQGSYYSQFKGGHQQCSTSGLSISQAWAEITEGRDFFKYNPQPENPGKGLIIISNPPYSILDKVLQRSVDLEPDIISYLIGMHNVTPKRIEFMESKGYYIKDMKLMNIYKWFMMTCQVTWVKYKSNYVVYKTTGLMNYSRKIYYPDEVWAEKKQKKNEKKLKQIQKKQMVIRKKLMNFIPQWRCHILLKK